MRNPPPNVFEFRPNSRARSLLLLVALLPLLAASAPAQTNTTVHITGLPNIIYVNEQRSLIVDVFASVPTTTVARISSALDNTVQELPLRPFKPFPPPTGNPEFTRTVIPEIELSNDDVFVCICSYEGFRKDLIYLL